LLYTALYLVAGSVLLTVVYGLVAHNLANNPSSRGRCSLRRVRSSISARKTTDSNQVAKCKAALGHATQLGAAAQRSNTLRHLLVYGALGLGATTLLAAAIGWLIAGRILRPVHAITAAARRASENHLGERLAMTGPHDELRELADTFDDMLNRLDQGFASQRRFVATRRTSCGPR